MRNRLKQQIYRSQNVTNNINSSQENGDKTNAGAKRVVKPKKKIEKKKHLKIRIQSENKTESREKQRDRDRPMHSNGFNDDCNAFFTRLCN